MKYNRNKNILTTDLQIPDYDLEAGIKLAVTDSSAKGKKMHGITIDVTNKDIPQLSLVGHARYSTIILNILKRVNTQQWGKYLEDFYFNMTYSYMGSLSLMLI